MSPDLEAVLAHISTQLDELEARPESELTDEEKQQKADLEAEKKQVEDLQARSEKPAETEVERLRRELRERTQRDTAKAIATEITSRIREEQESESKQLAEMVRSEVSGMMGGDVEDVVRSVMKSMRGGSRFAGQGAKEDFVDHIAGGGDYKALDPAGHTRVDHKGAQTECKEIWESKSIGRFFSIVSRAQRSDMFLSEGEKQFVHEIVAGRGRRLDGKVATALAEATDSAGGFMVPQEWMPDILGLLRAATTVRRAGPRIVPFNKQMNQTSISSGATASYTAENATIAASNQVFAEAPLLTPKNLTGLVPVSNYLLADAAAAEELVRADLAEVMALREDLAFLRGTGSGGEPLGLRNKSGITLNPIAVPANGFQPTIANLRQIRATFRNLNSGAVRLAWFFHPGFLNYLETRTDTTGRFLLESNLLGINDDGTSGVIDGVPFYTSTQIPNNLTVGTSTNASDVMLVNMAETIVGINQELEIAVSSEASWNDGSSWNSAFQQNQTLFRAVIRHDIAHRRPQQIVVQTGVLI